MNHILLHAGDDGIKLYNSWTLTDTERIDPDVVWGKFQDHIEPKVNFRLQRFYLQKYSQAAGESIDDYITRCTLQAQKCRFSPAEANERLIEQLIIGTKIPEVQKRYEARRNANIGQGTQHRPDDRGFDQPHDAVAGSARQHCRALRKTS